MQGRTNLGSASFGGQSRFGVRVISTLTPIRTRMRSRVPLRSESFLFGVRVLSAWGQSPFCGSAREPLNCNGLANRGQSHFPKGSDPDSTVSGTEPGVHSLGRP